MQLLIGFTLALPGPTFSEPLALIMRIIPVDEAGLAFFFSFVGALRLGALYINGNVPHLGPRIRYFGSVCGVMVFSQLTVAAVIAGFLSHRTTLAAAVYGCITLGEIISCYRATYDAGHRGPYGP